MQKLEKADLVRFARDGRDLAQDEEALRYHVALQVLRCFLGVAWVDTYINPAPAVVSPAARQGREFFRTDGTASEDRFRYQERVARLAELLFQLQDVSGIAARCDSIVQGQIESGYAELEFAGHFLRRDIAVRLLDRSGVKGDDYDFDVGSDDHLVACEVKCKIESTGLQESTISNTLGHARKQLARGRPGIIGVKIPEAWISSPELESKFGAALDSFFRNSDRVVAVVARWERVLTVGTGGVIPYLARTYASPRLSSQTRGVRELVERLEGPFTRQWNSCESAAVKAVRELHRLKLAFVKNGTNLV